jgi:hypothetical protein
LLPLEKQANITEKSPKVKKWSLLQLDITFSQVTFTACLIFFPFKHQLTYKKGIELSRRRVRKFWSEHRPNMSQFKNFPRQGITHNTLISFSNPQVTSQYLIYNVTNETNQDQIQANEKPAIAHSEI